MANLIENNAYRILGLDVTASQKDILRRYKEIINRLKIEDYPEYDLDIYLPARLRKEENVEEAFRELQSQKNNIKEYFFWFQISNKNDEKAIEYLREEDNTKAVQTWKELADGETATAYFYKKNLAVLYCLLLLNEDNPKYLKESLSIWNEITNSDKFWIAFSKLYGSQNEQTSSQETIQAFRGNVVREISDIYTDLGQMHKKPEYIKDFQTIFGTYGESTEKKLLQPIYKKINDEIEEIRKIKITQDEKYVAEELLKIEVNIDAIKTQLNRLKRNGLYDESESKVVRDHAAEAIRAKAIDIHNISGLYEEAANLAKEAAKISGTESYKKELEEDEVKIGKSIEADKNSLVSVNLGGGGLWNILSGGPGESAEFKLRFVEYKGKRMLYNDITEISFNGVKTNYSTTYSFTFVAGEEQLLFSLSDQQTYTKLVNLAYQLIISQIVKRYIDRIFEKNQIIDIGGVNFNKDGYTRQKFWGGDESVAWKEIIYQPTFFMGNVVLYKDKGGKGVRFTSIPMTTPNAVVLPALLKGCVDRAFALGLIPAKKAEEASGQGIQFSGTSSNEPIEGSQEYYDRIDKAERPTLLKAFEESGGLKMPKSWIEALKTIREKNIKDDLSYNIDKDVIKQLLAKEYIKEEKGVLSTKYIIQKKGFNILNWIFYRFK